MFTLITILIVIEMLFLILISVCILKLFIIFTSMLILILCLVSMLVCTVDINFNIVVFWYLKVFLYSVNINFLLYN